MNTSILYTSLFTSGGIGEYFLNEIGCYPAVANEIESKRVAWYQSMHPNTAVICGDITNPIIFEELVQLHKDNGCVGVMASPVCRDFTLANNKRNPNSDRANLYKYVLAFVERTNPEWVIIENSDQMSHVIVEGQVVAIRIVRALSDLGYNVAHGVQDAAYFGTPQHRRRTIIMASRIKQPRLPILGKKITSLRKAIGNLPVLEIGEKSNIKWHDASNMTWTSCQIDVMKHTPSAQSAHFNPNPYLPINADGTPSNAKFKCSFQRRDWDDACNTILQDSKSISGFRTCHPGNFIGYDDQGLPLYDNARPLTILELLRVTGLPDDYPIPEWASDNLIRQMMGDCWAPLHAKACVKELIGGTSIWSKIKGWFHF